MTDFFVAGSWRNRDAILEVLDVLDRTGRTSYCFVRETYPPEAAAVATAGGADVIDLEDAGVGVVFERDLHALRKADRFLLVLPAGRAGHIEAGIAYGLGKACYTVGPVDRAETLYRLFDRMFAQPDGLGSWLTGGGGLSLTGSGPSAG